MANDPALWLHMALAAALFYTVFCRAVRLSGETHLDVRLAFFALGLVACLAMAWPFYRPGWSPDLLHLVLLAGIDAVQIVTARYWCNGVPSRFLKPSPACDTTKECHHG